MAITTNLSEFASDFNSANTGVILKTPGGITSVPEDYYAPFSYANSAFVTANSGISIAQAAFDSANNVAPQIQPSFDHANAAFDVANTKFNSSGGTISGSVDIAGSLVVEANLTVSGTVTTISANNISVQDNMIYLNDGAANNANPDLGIVGAYNDGTYHHAGFFRDATDGVWKVFDNYEPEPDASVWIDTSNNTFRIADFEANNITAGGISLSSDFRLPVGNTAQRPEASAGKLYYNSETGKFEGYGSAWGSIGGGALISDSAPSNPSSGDLWWNSSDGKTYIYYDSTWVQAQPGGEGQYLPLTGGTITGDVTVTEVLTANSLTANAVTANTFIGSGSGLTGIPNSALSNSSITINGTQIGLGNSGSIFAGATITNDTTTNATRYVMLGSATSGAYTSANVSSTKLTFNPSTGLLSSTESYAYKAYAYNIYAGTSGSNLPLTSGYTMSFYISATGNDTTGDGSYDNPWLTLQKAIYAVPRFLIYNCSITFKNGDYTLSYTTYISNISGPGTLYIQGESSSVNINSNGYAIYAENNKAKIYISSLNITFPSGALFSATNCDHVTLASTVNFTRDVPSGGYWNVMAGFTDCRYVYVHGTYTVTSGSYGGYGGFIVFTAVQRADFYGTLTKSGTQATNSGITACNGTFLSLGWATVNNFLNGVLLGINHYGAELPSSLMINSSTISNCNRGVYIENNSSVNQYAATFTSNSVNYYYANGYQNGLSAFSDKLLLGYTASNGTYKLQVNSQIFATSGTIATSDGRYKENVIPLSNALSLISSLNPVQFNWKTHPVHNFDTETPTIGFIAQEVMSAFADVPYLNSIVKKNEYEIKSADIESIEIEPSVPAVYDDNGNVLIPEIPAKYEEVIINPAEKEEFYGIAESNLIALLTKSIQELKQIVDIQQAEIESQKALNQSLLERVGLLELK